MKHVKLLFFSIVLFTVSVSAQNYKPFVRAFQTEKTLDGIKTELLSKLPENGITILGQYQPANDVNRWIIAITSTELIQASQKVGGAAGIGIVMRIAITVENGKTKVTYTNPNYWAHAYYGDEYPKIAKDYETFHGKLKAALIATGENYKEVSIGSREGISVGDLHSYKYKMGAPTFSDYIVLGEFASYQQAVDKIESSIANGVSTAMSVYSVEVPNKQIKVYGFGLGVEYEFLYNLDTGSPKHTAAFPYEIAVVGNQVIMLDAKFRLTLCFPDCDNSGYKTIDETSVKIQEILAKLVQ